MVYFTCQVCVIYASTPNLPNTNQPTNQPTEPTIVFKPFSKQRLPTNKPILLMSMLILKLNLFSEQDYKTSKQLTTAYKTVLQPYTKVKSKRH